jgi:hypothetical protein
MTDGREFDTQATYRIRVKGKLDEEWSDWFDGLTITQLVDGETFLTGPVADQAALHSILGRIRDMGLPLLSVERMERQGGKPKAEIAGHVILSEEGDQK